MKKIVHFVFLLLGLIDVAEAQFTRYIVKLKNKGGNPFSLSTPGNYLSIRAVARRNKYGIAVDSTDLPVTPAYVTQIRNVANVTVLNVSKWLNAVTIYTTDAAAITTISGFSFVQSVTGSAARGVSGDPVIHDKFETVQDGYPVMQRPGGIEADYYNYGTASYNEIHLHNGEFLHNIGLRGQTIQIAMLDNGFNNYLALKAFDSVNAESRVLGTWDFVAREANVANDGSHGMNCFSTIAANIPGQFIGKAPKASFWLYQTEDNGSETPIEEFNWVCGAERADSSGADVISSSLGYMTFDNASLNHTYSQMDGNTCMGTIGADLAAKKGILTFLAAGNEGTSAWHYIISPSDGDSVIAVGAVSSAGNVGSFSSYGPSSDGQVKPDIASVGVAALVQNTNNTIGTSNGTSFACPNMAGMGACLWQGFPEFNNMTIVRALQLSGHRAATPDDRTGYGIPNVKAAFAGLLVAYATSTSSITGCAVTVNWVSKDVSAMKYEVERKGPSDPGYTKIADVSSQAGTVLANHTYQYINNLTSGSFGIYSYRIRQVIDTNAATFMGVYIDTTNIFLSSPCIVTGVGNVNPVKRVVSVQPNPVTSDNATLVIENTSVISNMPIMIYDAKGTLVMRINSSKASGKKTVNIPLHSFSRGKYYIKVFDGERPVGTAEMLKL